MYSASFLFLQCCDIVGLVTGSHLACKIFCISNLRGSLDDINLTWCILQKKNRPASWTKAKSSHSTVLVVTVLVVMCHFVLTQWTNLCIHVLYELKRRSREQWALALRRLRWTLVHRCEKTMKVSSIFWSVNTGNAASSTSAAAAMHWYVSCGYWYVVVALKWGASSCCVGAEVSEYRCLHSTPVTLTIQGVAKIYHWKLQFLRNDSIFC